MHAVERWFGDGFVSLHPLLQQLHRHGGKLSGTVAIEYGSGFAGWLGRRMASKFGIPKHTRAVELEVVIRSDDRRLYWNRTFAGVSHVESVFVPVGAWPSGYWVERTGLVTLSLRVDTRDGGWHWMPFKCSFAGVPLPTAFMPRVTAYKAIEDGMYRFYVGVSLPLVGFLFSYSGVLALSAERQAAQR